MSEKADALAIGIHCPVYLWAGPGTVRMIRLKYMNAQVDEQVHIEAHTPVGAHRLAQEAGFNWAYLMYDWGFPPETEQEDWEAFCQAVQIYHAAGIRVFGYIQTSNCVYAGSYRRKDWYVMDASGRPFYYYTGRYMTCWSHPEWSSHLREMIRGILEAGADGIYFDNPWHGVQPVHFGGAWLGSAGCYCPRCQAAFREATGLEIPAQIDPETDEVNRHYLRWRAEQVTGTLGMLADCARSLKPDVVVSALDIDAVMRPSYLIYGNDLSALARVQDVIMIEDFCLPGWDGTGAKPATPLLVNNALTLRTARALVGDTPLSTAPIDKGMGFDAAFPPRRLQQGMAEAAACGAVMVVKGTEYVEDGTFTLLTAERFAPQRQAIGHTHRWLAKHADLYQNRENAAPVGLLYPGHALWQAWDRLAPLYFGVGQTLLAAGVPWRVLTLQDDLSGLKVLFCFGEAPTGVSTPSGLRIIAVPDLPGWTSPSPSFLARHGTARSVTSRLLGWLFRGHFRRRWARWLANRLGMVHFFLQSPYFRLPPPAARQSLLAALGERPYPRVTAEVPVLVELWRQGERWQLHLVNYAAGPQRVTVVFDRPVTGQAISPDGPVVKLSGQCFDVALDVYTVLLYTSADEGEG